MSVANAPRSIYVMSCGRLMKIGTARDAKARRKLLQTGNGNPIELELTVTFGIGSMISGAESLCHMALRRWRSCGEWFMCSRYVAIGCVIDATQHMVGCRVVCHTQAAENAIGGVQEAMLGQTDFDYAYEVAGTDPPWPRGAFWWFDTLDKGGVVRPTWIEKELCRNKAGVIAS